MVFIMNFVVKLGHCACELWFVTSLGYHATLLSVRMPVLRTEAVNPFPHLLLSHTSGGDEEEESSLS